MDDPQLETAAPEPTLLEQVAAMAKPPIVRMDRSRDFASVHGDRPPGDPLAGVFFFQDKLPYNAQGVLLHNHPLIKADPALVKKTEKLLRRAIKLREQEPPEDDDDDDDEDDDDNEDRDEEEGYQEPTPVNLTAWAAGNQQVQWQEVSNAIARRYAKRVQNKRDAIELLVAEKVITVAALSKANRKLLESD